MKTLSLIFSLLVLPFALKADQLQWISKEDAQKAVDFFAKNKKVILWCGCCNNDKKEKVKIKSAEIKHTGTEKFYEVIITYKSSNKEMVSVAVDLAYVHHKVKKMANCVGKSLKMECDPCSDPFSWKL